MLYLKNYKTGKTETKTDRLYPVPKTLPFSTAFLMEHFFKVCFLLEIDRRIKKKAQTALQRCTFPNSVYTKAKNNTSKHYFDPTHGRTHCWPSLSKSKDRSHPAS